MSFCNGLKIQFRPLPQSGTLNSGEGIKTVCQLSYLPSFAQQPFFCFREAKSELMDLSLSQGSIKKSLEGVIRTISKNESAIALRQWMDHCEKYVRIGSD
jgi:hypothetical protein